MTTAKKKTITQKAKTNAKEGKASTAGGVLVAVLGLAGLVGQATLPQEQTVDPAQTTAYAGLLVAGLGAVFGLKK